MIGDSAARLLLPVPQLRTPLNSSIERHRRRSWAVTACRRRPESPPEEATHARHDVSLCNQVPSRFAIDTTSRGESKVLDEAELVSFGVGHDKHDPFAGIVVALPGPSPAQTVDLSAAFVDVVDLHVEVEPSFPALGFEDALEGQSRYVVEPRAEGCPVGPFVFSGERPIEQGAPEPRQTVRVGAVDGDAAPAVAHM